MKLCVLLSSVLIVWETTGIFSGVECGYILQQAVQPFGERRESYYASPRQERQHQRPKSPLRSPPAYAADNQLLVQAIRQALESQGALGSRSKEPEIEIQRATLSEQLVLPRTRDSPVVIQNFIVKSPSQWYGSQNSQRTKWTPTTRARPNDYKGNRNVIRYRNSGVKSVRVNSVGLNSGKQSSNKHLNNFIPQAIKIAEGYVGNGGGFRAEGPGGVKFMEVTGQTLGKEIKSEVKFEATRVPNGVPVPLLPVKFFTEVIHTAPVRLADSISPSGTLGAFVKNSIPSYVKEDLVQVSQGQSQVKHVVTNEVLRQKESPGVVRAPPQKEKYIQTTYEYYQHFEPQTVVPEYTNPRVVQQINLEPQKQPEVVRKPQEQSINILPQLQVVQEHREESPQPLQQLQFVQETRKESPQPPQRLQVVQELREASPQPPQQPQLVQQLREASPQPPQRLEVVQEVLKDPPQPPQRLQVLQELREESPHLPPQFVHPSTEQSQSLQEYQEEPTGQLNPVRELSPEEEFPFPTISIASEVPAEPLEPIQPQADPQLLQQPRESYVHHSQVLSQSGPTAIHQSQEISSPESPQLPESHGESVDASQVQIDPQNTVYQDFVHVSQPQLETPLAHPAQQQFITVRPQIIQQDQEVPIPQHEAVSPGSNVLVPEPEDPSFTQYASQYPIPIVYPQLQTPEQEINYQSQRVHPDSVVVNEPAHLTHHPFQVVSYPNQEDQEIMFIDSSRTMAAPFHSATQNTYALQPQPDVDEDVRVRLPGSHNPIDQEINFLRYADSPLTQQGTISEFNTVNTEQRRPENYEMYAPQMPHELYYTHPI